MFAVARLELGPRDKTKLYQVPAKRVGSGIGGGRIQLVVLLDKGSSRQRRVDGWEEGRGRERREEGQGVLQATPPAYHARSGSGATMTRLKRAVG